MKKALFCSHKIVGNGGYERTIKYQEMSVWGGGDEQSIEKQSQNRS